MNASYLARLAAADEKTRLEAMRTVIRAARRGIGHAWVVEWVRSRPESVEELAKILDEQIMARAVAPDTVVEHTMTSIRKEA